MQIEQNVISDFARATQISRISSKISQNKPLYSKFKQDKVIHCEEVNGSVSFERTNH